MSRKFLASVSCMRKQLARMGSKKEECPRFRTKRGDCPYDSSIKCMASKPAPKPIRKDYYRQSSAEKYPTDCEYDECLRGTIANPISKCTKCSFTKFPCQHPMKNPSIPKNRFDTDGRREKY